MFEDGSIGVVFALLTLWKTDWSDPFAEGLTQPSLAYSIGQTYENSNPISQEFRRSHFTDRTIGPVQVMWDASVTTKGGIFLGGGGRMDYEFNLGPVPVYAGISALVGLWHKGNDVDLGFPIEFRTDVEVGVEFREGMRLSVVTDHRSHARLAKITGNDDFKNGGMESIAVRLTHTY